MLLLIILGALAVWGVIYSIVNGGVQSRHRNPTMDDISKMNVEMIGKSKAECRQILKKYTRWY